MISLFEPHWKSGSAACPALLCLGCSALCSQGSLQDSPQTAWWLSRVYENHQWHVKATNQGNRQFCCDALFLCLEMFFAKESRSVIVLMYYNL